MSQGSLRDWSRIAAKLPGRTNKDCRKRWTKICTADLKKGAWSFEEDDKLRKAVSELGQQYVLKISWVQNQYEARQVNIPEP